MNFTVRVRLHAKRQLARWHLPDPILMEAYLRAQNDLAQQPAQRLERTTFPFDGLAYTFLAADLSNRRYGYVFLFQVKYGTDEETLWIVRGMYERVPLSGI